METRATAFPLAAANFRTPALVDTMQSITLHALEFSWTLKAPWFMHSLLVLCSRTMKTLARALTALTKLRVLWCKAAHKNRTFTLLTELLCNVLKCRQESIGKKITDKVLKDFLILLN